VTGLPNSAVEPLVAWLRAQPDCRLEDGLSAGELDRVEQHFGIQFPPLWREVLARVDPIPLPKPPRGKDGVLRWTAYPDWRLRDEAGTRDLIDAPVSGLLFDVERNDFWWGAWGARPNDISTRLSQATAHLATVPRLVPLWSHLYVATTDDSPVFSIVQADLYIPAVTIADLPTARDQGAVPLNDWPIGTVPFWSELHAYSQLGHQGPFAQLGSGGL
jgi:hypothetical protein